MRSILAIEGRLAELIAGAPQAADAPEILNLGEEILEHWVGARGEAPTTDRYEKFRLLALHRQGAHGLPSFNACRDTCRELAHHYNLLTLQPEHSDAAARRARCGPRRLEGSSKRGLIHGHSARLQSAG